MLKELRVIRYKEKIEFIVASVESIPGEPKGDIEVSATYYKLITAIEAGMDIVAMLLKDLGEKVSDDYSNIELMVQEGYISSKLGKNLMDCNGMRNRLVHRYEKVEEEVVIGSLGEVISSLYELIERTEVVLNEIE